MAGCVRREETGGEVAEVTNPGTQSGFQGLFLIINSSTMLLSISEAIVNAWEGIQPSASDHSPDATQMGTWMSVVG